MTVPSGTQVYDSCDPMAHAGDTITLVPTYQLHDGQDMLNLSGPTGVRVAVEGPRLKLEPTDIAGVYPSPGSDDSPADYLSHIALNRRTFAWERSGPAGKPWLALLTVKASEITSTTLVSTTVGEIADPASHDRFHNASKMNLPDSTPLLVANLSNVLLLKILPRLNEIELLCHMKRVLYDDNGTNKQDFCIIVGNRLPTVPAAPSKPELHTVLLVSLEHCDDLYDSDNNFSITRQLPFNVTSLAVLYSWSFTPSPGRDFEAVMKSIRIRPNGGVLRFGSEAWPADQGTTPLTPGLQPLLKSDGYFLDPLPHDQPGNIEIRGPLCPFPLPADLRASVAVRAAPEEFDDNSGTLDYSYAAAFELGRLLALSNSAILESLRNIYNLPESIFNKDLLTQLPDVLQKLDWVVSPQGVLPEGWEQPWQTSSLINDDLLQNSQRVGDYTGIGFLLQQSGWQAGVLAPLTAAGPALSLTAVEINLDTATPESIGAVFSDVRTNGS